MSKEIIYRPVISDKAEKGAEKLNKYTFLVNRRVNKIEIKKAIEKTFNVEVVNVNTLVMPAKAKSRFTKKGLVRGKTKVRKKAIITVAEGDVIDFYEEI